MTSPKYNKFNTGKTKGFFPINKWRCDTTRHPVIVSSEKCASSTPRAMFSQQELQMLVGLSNTLQCDERNAVRIALYEASRSAEKACRSMFRYASSESIEKGHQGRSSAKRWKLPKKEQMAAAGAAKELGITGAEFVRLSIIWLQLGIRRDDIKNIENCRVFSCDSSAHKWSRDNQGRPPSPQVANLKKVQQEAQNLFDYLRDIEDHKRFRKKEDQKAVPNEIREEIEEYVATQYESLYKLLELDFNSFEDMKFQMELRYVCNLDIDWDTAILIVQDDLKDYSDPRKLKPIEKLNLLKQGREIAAERLKLEQEKHKAAQAELLTAASEEWIRRHPRSNSFDLEQLQWDREAAAHVMQQENYQDRKDYLNEPMLWDEDSHKCLL